MKEREIEEYRNRVNKMIDDWKKETDKKFQSFHEMWDDKVATMPKAKIVKLNCGPIMMIDHEGTISLIRD